MTSLAPRHLERTDRYVRRGRLSLTADSPSHKLTFMVEESLRLSTLPGEHDGRVYYFRRLHITELPADGDRRAWLEAFQIAMREQALHAVHGSDPQAATAEAVYFHSELEACRALLMLTARGNPPTAWFWPHVSGTTGTFHASAMATAIIERLLASPPGWCAVSATFLSLPREQDVVNLLNLLPTQEIERWLRDIGGSNYAHISPVRLPAGVQSILTRAIQALGLVHPKVLWLASLAVLTCDPASMLNKSAVAIARSSLREIYADPQSSPPILGSAAEHTGQSSATISTHASANPLFAMRKVASGAEQSIETAISADPGLVAPIPSHPTVALSPADLAGERDDRSTDQPRDEILVGEPTSGAGLYFLLNTLDRIGVEREHFSLLFVARLFQRIADHAAVERRDPILRWVEAIENQNEPEEIDERLLRLWLLKIRRWCWRRGQLTVIEIVRRPGYVTLTKTDLDVTMPLDSADIRIRRIGLDLDPGWCPWFGRVVHFHYGYRGEFRG